MSHTLQVRGQAIRSFYTCPCGARIYPAALRLDHESWHRQSEARVKRAWLKDPVMKGDWKKRRGSMKTARHRIQIGDNPTFKGGVIIEASTLGKNDPERVSEESLTCQSPVCKEKFEQTGVVRLEPRKYCRDQCRLDAWHLREASRLLKNETDQRVLEIMRGKP